MGDQGTTSQPDSGVSNLELSFHTNVLMPVQRSQMLGRGVEPSDFVGLCVETITPSGESLVPLLQNPASEGPSEAVSQYPEWPEYNGIFSTNRSLSLYRCR